jgi:glycosyltransferase involved in cell wall biosynthesis
VIHDPSEVTKKTSPILLEHLPRFRIITIRKSVQDYLKTRFGFHSEFIIHPFYPYPFHRSPHPSKAVSISRIDFDKHTDIILEANKQLPANQTISIYGAANLQYVFFKLQGLNFHDYYKGKFDKTFEALNAILEDAKWVVDMSVIKQDGGGSQYSFLEAIHQGCTLVINRRWVEGFKTNFQDGKNCFVVADGQELAELIKRDPNTSRITNEAKKLLEPHIRVNWVKKMDAYPKVRVGRAKTRKVAKVGKDIRGKTRRY